MQEKENLQNSSDEKAEQENAVSEETKDLEDIADADELSETEAAEKSADAEETAELSEIEAAEKSADAEEMAELSETVAAEKFADTEETAEPSETEAAEKSVDVEEVTESTETEENTDAEETMRLEGIAEATEEVEQDDFPEETMPMDEADFYVGADEARAAASAGWFARNRKLVLYGGIGLGAVILAAIVIVILFATKVLCFHKWQPATCLQPEICAKCGDTRGEPGGHDWAEATCEEPETCYICGVTQGEALGHDWAEASCEESETCKRCGETQGKALGHDWANATCEKPQTCRRCGETAGKTLGHDWSAATCEKPKTCNRCGATTGQKAGHKWEAATCQKPKTCSVCGKTEGSMAAHTWTPATLTAPKTCSVCGATEGTKLNYTSLGKGTVNVDDDSTLLLREGMSTSSKTLASLANGSEIDIWDCGSSDWYYAQGEGKYGYVNAAYVTLNNGGSIGMDYSGSKMDLLTASAYLNSNYKPLVESQNPGTQIGFYAEKNANGTAYMKVVHVDSSRTLDDQKDAAETYAGWINLYEQTGSSEYRREAESTLSALYRIESSTNEMCLNLVDLVRKLCGQTYAVEFVTCTKNGETEPIMISVNGETQFYYVEELLVQNGYSY